MRIIIYGLGAVGGGIAGALASEGKEVIGIARGGMLEALKAGSLKVHSAKGTLNAHVPVVAEPSEIAFRHDDAILLTMKGQDTDAALAALREAGVREQPIFCFQNGIANERHALRLFPNVHGVTVMMPITYHAPGEIVANSTPKFAIFYIGRYPDGTSAQTEALVDALNGEHLAAFAHDDVMATKRGKLIMNVTNAVDAALGPGHRGVALGKRATEEAKAVFKARGLSVEDVGTNDPNRKALMNSRPVPGFPSRGSSTAQSLLRKTGRVETDFLNGEIALQGRLAGVATPVNAFLAELSWAMARSGAVPGALDPDSLEARFRAWESGESALPG